MRVLKTTSLRPPFVSATTLGGLLGLALPLAVFASTQLTILLAATTVLVLMLPPRVRASDIGFVLLRNGAIIFPLLALAAWGATSALWSIVPETSLVRTFRLTMVLVLGAVLTARGACFPPEKRNRIGLFFALGFLAGLALLASEVLSDHLVRRLIHSLFGGSPPDLPNIYNRAATVAAVLVWPAGVALWRWRGRFAGLGTLAATGVLLARLESGAAVLAWATGIIFALIGYFRPRCARIILATGILVTLLVMPAAPRLLSSANPPWGLFSISAKHRLEIWRFTTEAIIARPLLGWGLEAARAIPGGERRIVLTDEQGNQIEAEALPLHPHSAPLQVRLELGIVGIALLAAFAIAVLARAPRLWRNRLDFGAGLGLTASIFVISGLSYGAWQTWWLATLWLGAAAMAVVASSMKEARAPS